MSENLNISFSLYNPKRKIQEKEDFSKQVLQYGLYNNYPQLINALYQRSGTASVCVDIFASFIYGEGFQNPDLGEARINNKGETFNDLLRKVAKSIATFRGAALHFNFNMLNEVTTIHGLEFEWCRLGLPSPDLWSDYVAYWDDWDNQSARHDRSQADIEYFPRFNIDNVESEIEEAGFSKHPGQVLYFGLDGFGYPRSSFDSVLEDVETNSRIKNFKRNTVKNGFAASALIEYPGKFESEEERLAFLRNANSMTGDESAGSVKVVENQYAGELPFKIHILQPANVDKQFEITEKTVKANIIENYNIPKPLITGSEQVFSQDQIRESYVIYNEITRPIRQAVSSMFMKFLPYYKEQFDLTDGAKITSKRIEELEAPINTVENGGAATN